MEDNFHGRQLQKKMTLEAGNWPTMLCNICRSAPVELKQFQLKKKMEDNLHGNQPNLRCNICRSVSVDLETIL